jgi:hypothetical protein
VRKNNDYWFPVKRCGWGQARGGMSDATAMNDAPGMSDKFNPPNGGAGLAIRGPVLENADLWAHQ